MRWNCELEVEVEVSPFTFLCFSFLSLFSSLLFSLRRAKPGSSEFNRIHKVLRYSIFPGRGGAIAGRR